MPGKIEQASFLWDFLELFPYSAEHEVCDFRWITLSLRADLLSVQKDTQYLTESVAPQIRLDDACEGLSVMPGI